MNAPKYTLIPDNHKVEILGRPIRLADIVLTLEKKIGIKPINRLGELIEIYNLVYDDLSHQSPECIEFIYNLLQ